MAGLPNVNRPVGKPAGPSRATRAKSLARIEAAGTRARWRYHILSYAEKLVGLSRRQAYGRVMQAIAEGELPNSVPSFSTFSRWMSGSVKRSGALSLHHCVNKPHPGRPRTPLDEQVEAELKRLLLLQGHSATVRLWRDLAEFARDRGVEVPSLFRVKQFIRGVDLAELEAAAHGGRSALIRAMPKSTVPASRPHEVWTLDELKSPVWVRAYHPEERKWVSVRCWVVLVQDNYSRCIVGYRVVPPFLRGEGQTWTNEDVLGTVLAAALPDLAPSATRPFSGFLPETLRWDKHSTHHELRGVLAANGVHVPNLPAGMPHQRGIIEVLIGTLKDLCEGMYGHMENWVPLDRLTDHPKVTRTRQAASLSPARTKMEAPVAKLMTVEEFEAELGKKIERYHSREHRMLHRLTPDARYFSKLDEKGTRPGRDALFMLSVTSLRVSTAGLVHRSARFATEVEGRLLPIGTTVSVRPDPLLRGLYVMDGGDHHFVPPLEEWALSIAPGEFVEAQQEAVDEMEQNAERAREAAQREAIGPDGLAEVRDELDRLRKRRRSGPRVRGGDASTTSASQTRPESTTALQTAEPTLPRGLAGDPRSTIRKTQPEPAPMVEDRQSGDGEISEPGAEALLQLPEVVKDEEEMPSAASAPVQLERSMPRGLARDPRSAIRKREG